MSGIFKHIAWKGTEDPLTFMDSMSCRTTCTVDLVLLAYNRVYFKPSQLWNTGIALL